MPLSTRTPQPGRSAGDLIIAGTPERILLRKKSPIWLTAGDEVVVEIDRLGTLTNLLFAPEVRARGLPGHRKVAKSDPKLEAGRSHSRRNAGPPQLED
jgi:hypothetical protein